MKNILLFSLLVCLVACQPKQQKTGGINLLKASDFATSIDGKQVQLYTLKSSKGLVVQICNYGARLVSVWAPDRNGKYADILLGYQNINRYIRNTGERFLGPVVGRYANRIGKGKFILNGTPYQLPLNNNGQTLHGGLKGTDLVVWNVDKATDQDLEMTYVSPDGEEGFPGTLTIHVIYRVTNNNEVEIHYSATTDKPTVVNLSSHGIYNLKGEGNGTITDHILMLNASKTTPIDSFFIPTGAITDVDPTFDFRTPMLISKHINDNNEQLKYGHGYDHNWIIDRKTLDQVELDASVYEPTSGRYMEVWSDQPGIQFYSGNFFNGKTVGKTGKAQKYREGFALETQKFPDSPNHANFTNTLLNPGDTYHQTCIYKFSTK